MPIESARDKRHGPVVGGLGLRADAMRAVRGFFDARDYLEVVTPVWLATPALETYIDAVPAADGYLRTSPELHMKRLLAAGVPRIWQLGPCFRAGERGRRHLPEFWMLEWYRSHADYETVLRETRDLIVHVSDAVAGTTCLINRFGQLELDCDWERITVADAFQRFAGWNPVTDWDADRFSIDLAEKVEPALPTDRPVVLIDYPLAEAALARAGTASPSTAERWEVYAAGLELANAFSELTDAAEQRRRFTACAAARAARGATVYEPDGAFLDSLEAGMPPSAGVALGFDRLLMLLGGCGDISDTHAFVETIG